MLGVCDVLSTLSLLWLIVYIDSYDPRAVDIWGAALVMFFMATGQLPWLSVVEAGPGNRNFTELVDAWSDLRDQEPPQIGAVYPYVNFLYNAFREDETLQGIITSMLNPDPFRRLTVEQLVEHPWFLKQKCCIVYNQPSASGHVFTVATSHQHMVQRDIDKQRPRKDRVRERLKIGQIKGQLKDGSKIVGRIIRQAIRSPKTMI